MLALCAILLYMEDMDVVYICRSGPNEELRYSVRSVEKHLPHRKIWVVGQKPEWYKGAFLEVADNNFKYANARANLLAIVNSKEISEDFILMNDDFFIIRPVQKVEYFYNGSLKEKEESQKLLTTNGSYVKLLSNTIEDLGHLGIDDPLNYEVHIPMPLNKEKLKSVIRNKISLWRSLYGNINGVGGTDTEDVKIYPPQMEGYKSYNWKDKTFPYISTQDASFPIIHKALLIERFKHPASIEDEYED